MAEYRLTKRADKDLLAIYLYTVERFGQDQAERYTHDIKECFELLASNPHMRRVAVVHRRMRPPEPEAPEFWFSEGRTGRRRTPSLIRR